VPTPAGPVCASSFKKPSKQNVIVNILCNIFDINGFLNNFLNNFECAVSFNVKISNCFDNLQLNRFSNKASTIVVV
jgi:hypothetical protein